MIRRATFPGVLLDHREFRANESRKIGSCLHEEVTNQDFVLTPGVVHREPLRFTVLANDEQELQKIVAGNSLNCLGRGPRLKTNADRSIPEVPLVT